MTTYKISKENWRTLQNFNNLQECEIWVSEVLGDGYTIIVSPEVLLPLTIEEKLNFDIQYGLYLIEEFLIDNRNITPSVTPTESIELSIRFERIEKLLRLGDLKTSKYLIQQMVVDDRIFTQERKDKYINQLTSYLNVI
jgi:hypothetical protein